ncbi:MAG: hypothetical protein LBB53_01485, partial [Prevotellaceae bacterium]|nr:hypothetical protein [Prevotellaceae bacterium]
GDYPDLKASLYSLQTQEDVQNYVSKIKSTLLASDDLIGHAYQDLVQKLTELTENPSFYNDNLSNQINKVNFLSEDIRNQYAPICNTDLEQTSVKAMTEICLHSFMYWIDEYKMQEWEDVIMYAKKDNDKKDKKDKTKKEKKESKSVAKKVGEFVAADVGGACAGACAGAVLAGVGASAGAVVGGSVASGAAAMSWD